MSSPGRPSLRQRVLPFTGLIPAILMVPVLAANHYALGIIIAIASGLAVIAYHLTRGQGATSLDLLLLGFGCANAVLYFGFDETLLLDHIDAVIYTALAGQAGWSLVRGEPWTTQFTKRTVSPEAWELPEFDAVNRFSTATWAVGFAACDVVALVAQQPLRLYLPLAIMIALAVSSRPLARAYLARRLGVGVGALPAPWN
jgi:hypothetical protein